MISYFQRCNYSSPIEIELNNQVDNCHSILTSQYKVDTILTRLKSASPKSFAANLKSVEQGREKVTIVNV